MITYILDFIIADRVGLGQRASFRSTDFSLELFALNLRNKLCPGCVDNITLLFGENFANFLLSVRVDEAHLLIHSVALSNHLWDLNLMELLLAN